MQGYDLFMLIVLVATVVWGFWKGLAWQLASVGSIALSYFVALNFRTPLAALISSSIEVKPPLDIFAAMLILFMGTSLVVWVGFNLVSEMIEKVKLKEFDHQFGALFGFVKGVLLCVVITLFSVTLLSEPQQQAICNSRSGYYIALMLDRADPIMPRELHAVLAPYIHEFDQAVPHEHTTHTHKHTPGTPIIAVPNPNQFAPAKTPTASPSFLDPQTADRLRNQFFPPPPDNNRR